MFKFNDYTKVQNHFYLKARGIGASRKLWGKVALITVYAYKTPDCWSTKSKQDLIFAIDKAITLLEKEAKSYGAELKIVPYFMDINLPSDFERFQAFNYIKNNFKVNTMEEMQKSFEKHYNVDEAPVMIVYDELGRSSAAMQHTSIQARDEISSIFKSSSGFSYTTIAHEILHQFGATDFYFPKKVEAAAKKYFINSVMGIGSRDIVDDLTAYLVGWKNTLSENSYRFLRKTKWLTEKKYYKVLEKEWK